MRSRFQLAVALVGLILAACGSQHETLPRTPVAAAYQLAFIGEDGSIWVVNADGSGETRLAVQCDAETDRRPFSLAWSPDGDKLALLCASPDYTQQSLITTDAKGGAITSVSGVAFFRWSPDNHRIAYEPLTPLGTSPQAQVRMFDVASSQDTLLADKALLLDWPLPERLLLGLNPEPGELFFFEKYEAVWYELTTGRSQRVARLDDLVQFWIAPDGRSAIIVAGQASRDDGGVTLGVYDLESGEERPIPGAVIGYPSEGIPTSRLAISPDGRQLYWADYEASGDAIYMAGMEGRQAELAARLPGRVLALSGAGLVAYVLNPEGLIAGRLLIHDLRSDTEVEVGSGRFAAWGPRER